MSRWRGGVNIGRNWLARMDMANILYQLVPFVLGAVAIVLLLGLVNMLRGGPASVSQRLMRLRVLLQFVALIVIMASIWLMGQ